MPINIVSTGGPLSTSDISELSAIIIVNQKVASTYLTTCLMWCYPEQWIQIPHTSFRRSSWFYLQMDKEVYKNLHKVIITRNPYERFLSVSAFGYKISVQHTENNKKVYQYEVIDDFKDYKPIELKTTLEDMTKEEWQKSFQHFCEEFKKGNIEDGHAHSYVNELSNFPIEDFERVDISEIQTHPTLNKIFEIESERKISSYDSRTMWGDTENLGLDMNKNETEKYLPSWKDFYTEKSKKIVYDLFTEDFQTFKYSKDFSDY